MNETKLEWKTTYACYGCGKHKDGPGTSPCSDSKCKWQVTRESIKPL